MSVWEQRDPAVNRGSIRVTALCWLDRFVYGATLPGVLADKGFGLTAVYGGTIGSLTTFGMLLGALGSGIVTDRIGRRKIILTGVVVFSLASAACAMAPTVEVFGAARFVAGIGLGGLLPSAIAMVMEYAPPWRKNLSVTIVMTAHQAGGAITGALAMSVVESLGWRSVYWLGVVPLLVVLPVVSVMLPESMTYLLARGSGRGRRRSPTATGSRSGRSSRSAPSRSRAACAPCSPRRSRSPRSCSGSPRSAGSCWSTA